MDDLSRRTAWSARQHLSREIQARQIGERRDQAWKRLASPY